MPRSFHFLAQKKPPREGVIKYWTHAAGIAVVALVVPSICAVYIRHIGIADNEPSWVRTACGIWYAHAGLTVLTAMLWLVEKPRLTKFITSETDTVDWHEEDSGPTQHTETSRGK